MRIVNVAVRQCYRFNCPNCGSKLEADSDELVDVGGKTSRFWCPVCRLRGQFRRLSKPLYGKECFSMDTMFENLDFRFDKENNDERPFMIACKDREIMDGERWVLVSLSTDEAKRLLKYLEEHIAK